ncbi:MAG: DUF1415 domain-containing protein [Planctomycetes bacterium]|nr:DUF1415 domain-containing protein [Planctomycetota bacterium]
MDNQHPQSSAEQAQTVTRSIEHWLDEVVIGLNLCPFAAQPRRAGSIKIELIPQCDSETALQHLQRLLKELEAAEPSEHETTLVVFPDMLTNFDDFLGFLELADALVDSLGWRGTYQLASFHPDYCFAGNLPGAPANLTNRAPHPIVHLLREASVEQALANYPDPASIPVRNIKTVTGLSERERSRLFPHLSDPDPA